MTRIVFVNPQTNQVMLAVDTQEAIPVVGDILIPPNKEIHQIVQRAFVIEQVTPTGLVDLSKASQALSITIQCAVLPVESNIEMDPEGVRS